MEKNFRISVAFQIACNMKATILAIYFLTFTFGILAKELENRQWSGGSAGGSSSALRRQIRKLEYQLEEEQKKNQELTETNEMLKETNQKCQGGNKINQQNPVAQNTQGPMIPMTFGSTTRNPNLLRPSGPLKPRPSLELIQCQNDLKKEKDTNQEIRMQLLKYKKKIEECKANISTKEPVAATDKPNEFLNEGHHECKYDLEMAEKNIHDLQEKLEIEDKKNQELIVELEKTKNTTDTVKADLARCLEKDQNDENDNGELRRCQQDLSMKNDTIEQMKHFEKKLKEARKEINKLKSESGSDDKLNPFETFKKVTVAMVEKGYAECKKMYRHHRYLGQRRDRRVRMFRNLINHPWFGSIERKVTKPICKPKIQQLHFGK